MFGRHVCWIWIVAASVGIASRLPAATPFIERFDQGKAGLWGGGQVQSQLRLGRSGGAFQVTPVQNKKTPRYYLSAQTKWRKSLYRSASAGACLTFAYYVTESRDISVRLYGDQPRKLRGSLAIREAIPKQWTYVIMPLGRGGKQSPGFGFPPRANLNSLRISYGGSYRTKPEVGFYIDDVRLVRSIPSDVSRAFKKQQRELKKYTYTMKEHSMRLNRNILLHLASKLDGKKTTPKSILLVGDGLVTAESFITLTSTPIGPSVHRGHQIIRDPAVADGALRFKTVVKAAKAALASRKPEVVAIWMGWKDLQEFIAERAAYEEKVLLGNADEKKAPASDKFRDQVRKVLDQLVKASLSAGAVPVLFTMPPLGGIKRGEFMPASTLIGMNGVVLKLASRHRIPIVDSFAVLAPARKGRRTIPRSNKAHARYPWLLPDAQTLTDASYRAVNDRFAKIYKALESELFKDRR